MEIYAGAKITNEVIFRTSYIYVVVRPRYLHAIYIFVLLTRVVLHVLHH